LTAYTPYQAEASQGTLQVIYEFQTMIARLTGMEVSNASHYDGSTALAEAVILSLHYKERREVLISSALHPHYKQVIRTYLQGLPSEVVEIPYTKEGLLDREFIKARMTEKTASIVLSSPNFFGLVENYEDIARQAHQAGALLVVNANPLALSFYASPKDWGADIVCGEGQPLGIRMNLGGPVLGFFAVTKELMRRIPGRIAGQTTDTEGRRAFVLTLQAREQHIRREKASSNICTNQALFALTATVYFTLMGEQGFKRVGEMNVANAAYLKEAISKLDKFSIPFKGPHFNEFVVRFEGDVERLFEKLLEKKILGGFALGRYYPELKNEFLVCATETKTREDLDRFAQTLEEVS
jgi:glycine dehydrogenase subunit 1